MVGAWQSGLDAEYVVSVRIQPERPGLLEMLPEIIRELAETVDKVTVDRVSVIDAGGNGGASGLSRFVTQFPAAVISLSEQIENATGVDILSAFNASRNGREAEREAAASRRLDSSRQPEEAAPSA